VISIGHIFYLRPFNPYYFHIISYPLNQEENIEIVSNNNTVAVITDERNTTPLIVNVEDPSEVQNQVNEKCKGNNSLSNNIISFFLYKKCFQLFDLILV
jgi:hypothetical protein